MNFTLLCPTTLMQFMMEKSLLISRFVIQSTMSALKSTTNTGWSIIWLRKKHVSIIRRPVTSFSFLNHQKHFQRTQALFGIYVYIHHFCTFHVGPFDFLSLNGKNTWSLSINHWNILQSHSLLFSNMVYSMALPQFMICINAVSTAFIKMILKCITVWKKRFRSVTPNL